MITSRPTERERPTGARRLAKRIAIAPGSGEAGFTIIEFAVVSVLLSVGLMGFLGAILTSQVMVRNSTARSKASTAVTSVVEKFRLAAITDYEAAVTAAIGGRSYYRMIVGDFRIDVSDSESQTSAINTTAPPPVIPSAIDLDTNPASNVTGPTHDESGNSVTTTTLDEGGVHYERVVTGYTSGSTGTTLSRRDANGSTAMQATIDFAAHPSVRLNYSHDAINGFTTYFSNVSTGPLAKPGLILYGVSTDDVDGKRIGIALTNGLVEFDDLAGVGTDARLTVTVVDDETSLEPRLDLNSDGDVEDVGLTAAQLKAAVLRVVLTWKDKSKTRQVEYSTILARGELR